METTLQQQVPTAAESEAEQFHTGHIMTIAGGHFAHDTYSAFLAPLLPLLQERLQTSYALTGSLAIFTQLPSLLNPLIGYIADRVSLRYLIILAPAVTGTLLSLMGLFSNYWTLAMLLVAAGFSIAAFHAPAPAMVARMSGRKVGRGMSIFMASGELGRTMGPIVAVAAINWFTLEGMWRLMFVSWAVSGILYFRLREISARTERKSLDLLAAWRRGRRFFLILGGLILLRSLLTAAITTYLPLFLSDVRAASLWLAGGALSILEAAGVVGALATGTLSDRYGRKKILLVLMTIAPFLLFLFLWGPTWMLLPLLIALGLTAISPTPVIMAMVQDQFPDFRALANGLYIAMNFLVRALAIWLLGTIADFNGLSTAYIFAGGAAFLILPLILLLPAPPDTLLEPGN
jgi:FSR family fosmidomycin resistance protein-like MFS transporter